MSEQEGKNRINPEENPMVAEALRLGGEIVNEEEIPEESKDYIREIMPDGKVQLIGKDGTRYDEKTGEVILPGSGEDYDEPEEN